MMNENMNFIDVGLKNSEQLLAETHHYIKWQAPLDVEYMSKDTILKLSCEAMRITVRITQIIGWLTLQKSILKGEISLEEVRNNKTPILQGETCLDRKSEMDPLLPDRLRELLKKSREFYIHTMKLEEMSLRQPLYPEEIRKKHRPGPRLCPQRKAKDSG